MEKNPQLHKVFELFSFVHGISLGGKNEKVILKIGTSVDYDYLHLFLLWHSIRINNDKAIFCCLRNLRRELRGGSVWNVLSLSLRIVFFISQAIFFPFLFRTRNEIKVSEFCLKNNFQRYIQNEQQNARQGMNAIS